VNRKIITGIGSLPFKDRKKAMKFSLKHPIPFVPELPLLGDEMFKYINHPGQLSCLPELSKRRFSILKMQSVGPVTMIANGHSEKEAIEKITDHIFTMRMRLKAREVICFLDEPNLETASFDYKARGWTKSRYESMGKGFVPVDCKKVWEDLFEQLFKYSYLKSMTWGIHTCSNMDWNLLFGLEAIKIISFDASKYGKRFFNSSGYRGDKRVAWGINTIEDILDFQKGDLITLPCGMSPYKYKEEECKPLLKKLKRIVRKL
jgi:hypothetical protein